MGLYEEKELFAEETTLTIVGIAKEPAKDWMMDTSIYADAAIMPELNQIFRTYVEDDEQRTVLR